MKNKKGFTLIELLAVIVILAIIALIAIPIVLNMINNARKKAAESSAYGFVEAIEYNNGLADVSDDMGISYERVTGTNLDVTTINVKMKGKRPTSGTVTIDETGKVTTGDFCIEGYQVTYRGKEVTEVKKGCGSSSSGGSGNSENNNGSGTGNSGNNSGSESGNSGNNSGSGSSSSSSSSGSPTQNTEPVVYKPAIVAPGANDTHKGIVYLNPTDLTEECSDSNSVSTSGTKIGCMKFYIYDDSGDNYKLILDHNTTFTVYWNSDSVNSSMKEVATALETDTAGWQGNPRLITANEVATVIGNTTFNRSISTNFFFGSNNNTGYSSQTEEQKARQRSFYWLFDYTDRCTSSGCKYDDSRTCGYWTSTPTSDYSVFAWGVVDDGSLNYSSVSYNGNLGVRPVITIPKTALQ